MRKRSIIRNMFVLLGILLIGFILGGGYVGYQFKSFIFDNNEFWLHQSVGYLIKMRNNDVDGCIKSIELGLDNAVRQIASEAMGKQGQLAPEELSSFGLRALQLARSYMDAGFESPFSPEAKQYLSQIPFKNPSAKELEGQSAPDFTLDILQGGEFSLSASEKHVIVLDFWTTTCGPCLSALPGYENIQQWTEENNKSVSIYCVNIKEDPELVLNLWNEQKYSMPVLIDSDGEVAKAYKVKGIPQTVIINDGIIRYVQVGVQAANEKNLKTRIETFLSNGKDK